VSDHASAVEAYQTDAIEAYLNAARSPGVVAAAAVLAGALADDVVAQTSFGKAEGVDAVLALLREPRMAGLFAASAQWSPPSADGDRVVVTAALPATAPFGGLELSFEFAGAKISRVEQLTFPPAPVPPQELSLTDDIKRAVDGALDNKTPMLIAYRDDGSNIHLSFRGSIHAYGDDALALWARDPQGGLPRNIAARPQVTLFYHDPATRTSYSFYGRARVEAEPAARSAIYAGSNPREQQADFGQRGVAIVVELDKLEGRGPAGRILMLRNLA
jgi:hypothetical protein